MKNQHLLSKQFLSMLNKNINNIKIAFNSNKSLIKRINNKMK